ncbi:MAG: glycosyltransferase family 39 protein [Candidatus Solibacter sp.]
MDLETSRRRETVSGSGHAFPVKWGILSIGLVFAFLVLLLVFTRRPWVDEAWFTGPGLDLATRGSFGTLLLDPAGSHLRLNNVNAVLQGIDRHTYWVMPFHLVQLAAWGKLFGFGIFSMRMPSVFWGAVTLLSVGFAVRRLYAEPAAALIAAGVLAVDFGFLNAASDGRMDMTGTALGFSAISAYLCLREKSFRRAVIGANVLAALAVFTHPNGVFGAAGLLLTMLWLDRKQVLRPLPVVWIAAPYLLLGGLWAIYCSQAPAEFMAQFSANAAARGNELWKPWRGVWREIDGRFRNHFFPEGSTFGKLKILGLLIYLAALATLASARKLRREDGCRLLLCLTLLQFLCLAVLAQTKNTYYIVYILPYFAAATGIAASYLWSTNGPGVRFLCATALLAYFAVQTTAVLKLALSTAGYRKEYTPLVQYLKANVQREDLVMGSAELGYALGFYNSQLVDDVWLGHWTGRQPTIVVVDRWYYQEVFATAAGRSIPSPSYFDTFLRDFRLVYDSKGYRVYRRIHAL